MARLITQDIDLTNANPTFQFNGSLTGQLASIVVTLTRTLAVIPQGEVRQLSADLLLSTDGGATFTDQGGVVWQEAVDNVNELCGTALYVVFPTGPGRRIRLTVTKVLGNEIAVHCTVDAT